VEEKSYGGVIKKFEALFIKLQKLKTQFEQQKLDFGLEREECLVVLKSLEIKLFVRIYQIQMYRPREVEVVECRESKGDFDKLRFLKDEIQHIYSSNDDVIYKKYEPIRQKEFIPKIKFWEMKEKWEQTDYLSNEWFYLVPQVELESFANIINEIFKYESLIFKQWNLNNLESLKTITKEDLIIDFNKEIERQKNRIRKSDKYKAKNNHKRKYRHENNDSDYCESKKKTRKSKRIKKEQSSSCSSNESTYHRKRKRSEKSSSNDYIMSNRSDQHPIIYEEEDANNRGSWILKVDWMKKRVRKKEEKRRAIAYGEVYQDSEDDNTAYQKGRATRNKRPKRRARFARRTTVGV
jgi:hypothetical protein